MPLFVPLQRYRYGSLCDRCVDLIALSDARAATPVIGLPTLRDAFSSAAVGIRVVCAVATTQRLPLAVAATRGTAVFVD
jgi:hypothetical protein